MKPAASLLCTCLLLATAAGALPASAQSAPTDPLLQVETGMHRAIINDVAISPDSSVLATASDDKTLRLWSLETGDLLDVFRPPISPAADGLLFTAAFAPSGSFLLSGGVTGLEWDGRAYIYLFGLPDGEIADRRLPLPGVALKIAYRKDAEGKAKYLAVAHGGPQRGLLVVDARAAKVAEDLEYAGDPTWLEFGPAGRLYAVGSDGYLRIYNEALKLVYRDRVEGREPNQVRPSPDGRHLAVSYLGENAVDILSAADGSLVRRLSAPNPRGVPYLGAVAWSQQAGRTQLWAAGGVKDGGGRTAILRWQDPLASDSHEVFPVARDAITRLEAGRAGSMVYATADPAWGVIDAEGRQGLHHGPEGGDFRNIFERSFALADGGERLSFAFGRDAEARRLSFDLGKQRLTQDAETSGAGAPAVPTALSDWRNSTQPRWNGKAIPLEKDEFARSAAPAPGGGAVIGADRFLYRISPQGDVVARQPLPAAAWGVVTSVEKQQAVVALGDGTLRWFDLREGHLLEELAALFVHRDQARWIMWLPDGRFTHSDNGGQNLAGYHVNDGKTEAGRWIDFAQLYRTYYDPVAVRQRLGIETAEADAGAPAPERPTEAAESLLSQAAPSITLIEYCPIDEAGNELECLPASRARRGLARVSDAAPAQDALPESVDRILVRFSVESAAPLATIDVFVNGRTTGQSTRGLKRVAPANATASPPESIGAERIVQLSEGVNAIEVRAYDARGIFGRSRALELIARPKQAEESLPRLYVLAIGVDSYRGDVPALSFARADAESIASTLRRQLPQAYGGIEAIELLDEAATAGAIEAAFDDIAARTSEQDSVVVYIAGHGTLDSAGTYQFLPAEVTRWEDIAEAGISQNELIGLLGRIRAANTAILVDTCHSGAFPAETPGTIVNETGFYVLAASASVEEALDGYDGSNGVFAHAVLEALGGEASGSRGLVDILGLGSFVRDRVPELAEERRFSQNAQFKFSGGTLSAFPISQAASP